MRSSWFTTIAVCVVIGLLTVFLGLQYNWLQQASAAERERMQKRVEIDTKNFADAFNREIQGAYFNFQADPDVIERGDPTEIAQRFDHWKQNTEFPDLIRQMIYVSIKPGTLPIRYDPPTRSFQSVEIDEGFAAIAGKISGEKPAGPVIDQDYALVVPIHKEEKRVEKIVVRRNKNDDPPKIEIPRPQGHFVVFLNEAVLKEQMLPAFSARFFPSNDYNIAITNTGGQAVFQTASISKPDAGAALFDLKPDNLIFFANQEILPRKSEPSADVLVNRRIDSRTFEQELRTPSDGSQTFTIQMKDDDGEKRTSVISSTSSAEPWRLNVQHSAGSVAAFVDGQRNQSMLIGFGVYLLLVGGILAIVISANRVRTYARRQIDFVSSVSHEFRTPLAVIYSAGENLADGVAKDEAQVSRYGDLIKGEGKKLSGMVEQILEFAGARSGKKKYNFARSDVGNIVRRTVEDCRELIDANGFTVEEKISDHLPTIKGDAEAIASAMRNLIQNAVKYSNGSRLIRVGAENGNGKVKLTVEDQGIGIDASDQKKIFEPFYRSKGVVDAQIHGNGLGLSLVKEIAEAHGGSVKVESAPGKGSKFTIELPLF